ncbi:hypothetical protein [Sulfuricurvum sp. RIFCSPLOWO2_12_FULL_43_24]|uniref:hypothetical protein n=1 Tax=Sulfuricurvum sp. RIFCSPLOWO2_12_FULL_43_24 TaxID=1802247 RepID=UPI0008C0002A|nr:hypothetical protein [Sulfuricurvum sp. RIFCSPLOWO2_12_FULL_43_24]OHD82903.1 MAG: hypothetical protein A3D90_09785 [Sulfuricurvum sp. RIFCSPHIGHO2_02_FULL_43_9]OHD86691.1 MAG: hypothetical protein A3I60_04245 [Sulfuricurvum sp. RIFCSPLOWO2_02_FULL_43_45]OHD89273.1 MAG: hypothetical protein A2W83_06225 [Sulfuricurvum sp. RIFCSPLOWO2_12_43_5]OHD90177.1 MAG: hypothetical protein A3G19_09670 [Sulfuricurvum sp. RIFCSPLOWO2_12_FULL_43_24]
MTTATSYDAYRSHELNIQMKTSSGDTLSLNFTNEQSLSLNEKTTDESKEQSFSFASMQAFSFNLDSNGISEQDQKEINAFMKKAQPYINKFMKELEKENQTSPINKVASDVTKLIGNLKNSDENVKNHAKKGVVDMFDNTVKETKTTEKMIEEAQKLMQKIIDGFDKIFEPVYA